jgi:hypothetical protein
MIDQDIKNRLSQINIPISPVFLNKINSLLNNELYIDKNILGFGIAHDSSFKKYQSIRPVPK